jgi:lysophospholipase L1-like esterase
MMIMKNRKQLMINLCLALISCAGSVAVGYYLYTQMTKPPGNILATETNDVYMFSLYNQYGHKISDMEGNFKLMIDPFTIYRNYPNQKSSKYSIDLYGFRNTYSDDNPYTAILLGGSAAFGFALDSDNQTFASKISMYSQKYSIINAAVIGFLSGQELSLMIHYLDDLSPSLYIIFNGWNDIYDPFAFVKSAFKDNIPLEQGPIGYNNAFFSIETRLADYFQLTRKDKKSPIPQLTPVGAYLNEDELFQKVLLKYIATISKMHSFANSRNAKFLLVFQPELGNKKVLSLNERESLDTWINKYGYLDNKITERYHNLIFGAKEYFLENSIPFIDINIEPEFTENPQTLFFDVVHPNSLGHEIIATIINRTLEKKF